MQEDDIVYCAIGTVDESAKTARALTADGEVITIKWDGDTPASGMVNAFKKDGEVYRKEPTRTYPPIGGGFESWEVYISGRQKRFIRTDMYYTDENTAFFVRYSDTEWRVYKGRAAMINDDPHGKVYMYYTSELDGIAKVVRYAMVVGEYGEEGKWAPATAATSMFLDPNKKGWDSGDKDLS